MMSVVITNSFVYLALNSFVFQESPRSPLITDFLFQIRKLTTPPNIDTNIKRLTACVPFSGKLR